MGWAADQQLFVQRMSPDGTFVGEPIGVPEPRETAKVTVVGTDTGALLAYEARAPGAATQVAATPLRCE